MILRASFYATLCGLSLASPAFAHPHIFVDARAGFIFNEAGQLSALRIHWTYDAFTSLTLFDILDLDKDNDGALDDADRAAIVAGETEWQDGYKGDTYLEAGGADVPLAKPVNGSAWLAEDRISVTFDLPLQVPLQVTGEILLKLYDPSYYYAYTVIGLEETEMGSCMADFQSFEPDEAAADLQAQLALLSQEETPEQEDVGRLFADEVRLRCP